MHPVLKRILITGGLTAAALAGIGFLFSHMAGMWASTNNVGKAGATDPNVPITESIRSNVPLMMAFWGFVFVTVAELIRWRLGGTKTEPKHAEKQPDEAEKLLNELLAQAESKMAVEAESQRAEDRGQKTEEKPEAASEK